MRSTDSEERPRKVFLFGDPVAHSISPLIHNTAFQAAGIQAKYEAIRVEAADLEAAIQGLRDDDLLGANITVPHKRNAIEFVDELDGEAKLLGAINTISPEGGRLVGFNTDVAGFLAPLKGFSDRLRGSSVVVFGAGGAARAVCFACVTSLGVRHIAVVARRLEQSQELVHDLRAIDTNSVLEAVAYEQAAPFVQSSTLVVNATPLGMEPAIRESPWESVHHFNRDHILYDLVYSPRETTLMRAAQSQGATTISGLPMLIAQAAASFRRWTGMDMPIAAVEDVVRSTL